MISENDEGEIWRERAVMTWAFISSTPVSLLLWLLLGWVMLTRPDALRKLAMSQPTPLEYIESTSIVHMDRKPVPVPQQPIARPQPVQRQREQQKSPEKAQPTPEARPTEIARIVPKAPPQPTPAKTVQKQATLAETLAQQQVAFSKEAAQLSAANHAPISVATIDPNQAPSSQHQYQMDFSGIPGFQSHGDGIITPVQEWRDNGMNCYRGRYWYEYPTGSVEQDTIPWPFCYPPRQDPFTHGVHRIPFPLPLPGFRLPPGAQLTKIEAEVYNSWVSQ